MNLAPAPDADLLDEAETASELRLSPMTLRSWRSRGSGPPFLKVGSRVVYDRQDLRAWLANHRRNAPSPKPATARPALI